MGQPSELRTVGWPLCAAAVECSAGPGNPFPLVLKAQHNVLLTTLISLLALFMYVPVDARTLPWVWTVAGVAALAAANLAASWVGARLATRLAERGGPGASMGPVRVFRTLHAGVIGFLLVAVYGLDWPRFAAESTSGLRWLLVADELLLLSPALVMLVTVAAFRYRYESSRRRMALSLWKYLDLRLRVEVAIVVAPILVLMAISDAVDMLFAGSAHYEAVSAGVGVAFVLALITCAPLMLRALWRMSPLPPGSLRERLEAYGRAQRFRCTDILVWHTRGYIPNAGVIGFLPQVRYVLISDVLLQSLSEDEIEAVFAHEVGHAKRRHMAFYLVFALAFACFYANAMDALSMLGLVEPVDDLLGGELTTMQAGAMLALAVVYWWVVFGWLSRRHEEQADIFALRTARRPEAFITALQRLGALSGRPGGAGGWRHFGIARRTTFLSRALTDPGLCERVDRKLRRIRFAILGLLALGALRLIALRPDILGP